MVAWLLKRVQIVLIPRVSESVPGSQNLPYVNIDKEYWNGDLCRSTY